MYDFKTLSSHDFELLTRDLLQEHLNVFLESFKSGRDKGIDLRYAPTEDESIIIQCKHYASTGYSGLFSTLKNELPKVKKLNPKRYIIVTSVGLTPKNKDDIANIFSQYCSAEKDIFGCDEINNLLTKHDHIERQHFKLWLSSTTILEKVLHNGLYNQTSMLVESIQNKTKYYVQNTSFYDAIEIIKSNNYCIISGIPGIGKTFLAEILLLHHINNGYMPVVVRSHISEAFEMLKASTKQVFYFDDFLGQTGLEEKLVKNEEQSILDFIKYSKNHAHAKFILTTREYILQQARNVYEKLHAPEFEYAKCVINLDSYTRNDRAHILLNHIYFSELPIEHRKALTKKKPLLEIIDHDNYSPRIIEWMSDYQNIRDYDAHNYPKYFLETLANPEDLWQHAFRKHLSPPARSLLMVMMTFRFAVDFEDLKEAYHSYRSKEIELFGGNISQGDFRSSLDELEGSFIWCERDNHNIFITFHNPSVLDFLEKYVSKNAEILRMLCGSIIFYDQFLALCLLRGGKEEHEHIASVLGQEENLIPNSILASYSRTAKQRRLEKLNDGTYQCLKATQTTVEDNILHSIKISKHLAPDKTYHIARALINEEISRISTGIAIPDKISEIVKESYDIKNIEQLRDELIKASALYFEKNFPDEEDVEKLDILAKFIKIEPKALSPNFIDTIKKEIEEDSETIFDWKITDAGSEYDITECREMTKSISTAFGVDLSSIEDWIDDREEQIKEEYYDSPDDWYRGGDEDAGEISDSDIFAIFGSLDD